MEKFLESEDYQKMKKEVELEHFKLFGEYVWYHNAKVDIKSVANMITLFKNKHIEITVEEKRYSKGKEYTIPNQLKKTFFEIWETDPKQREYKEMVFECDNNNVLDYQFNLFNGFKHLEHIKEGQGDLSPVFEHIRTLVNYNESHFEYVLNYLAQLVQQPHILSQVALVFISEEGVGKDKFAKFLKDVIGQQYYGITEKLELICGKFNTSLDGKLLFVLNETNPIDSRDRIENIKSLISAEEVAIEKKNKDPVYKANFCRFIFFSNRPFAFPVEGGARRPFIVKSSNKYLPDQYGVDESFAYFSKLVDVLLNKQVQKQFLKHLQTRDIAKFNPKKFDKSEFHTILEENSMSPVVGFLGNFIKTNELEDKIRLSTQDALMQFTTFMKQNNYKFDYSQAKFNVEIESTFQIRKIKTGGKMMFEFDIKILKKLLETKYKYVFNEVDDIEPEITFNKKKIRNIDYKSQYEEAIQRIEELEAQLKPKIEPKEDFIIVKGKLKKTQTFDELDKEIAELDKPKQSKYVIDDEPSEDELDLNEIETMTNFMANPNKLKK
jgi:hypothetical protein